MFPAGRRQRSCPGRCRSSSTTRRYGHGCIRLRGATAPGVCCSTGRRCTKRSREAGPASRPDDAPRAPGGVPRRGGGAGRGPRRPARPLQSTEAPRTYHCPPRPEIGHRAERGHAVRAPRQNCAMTMPLPAEIARVSPQPRFRCREIGSARQAGPPKPAGTGLRDADGTADTIETYPTHLGRTLDERCYPGNDTVNLRHETVGGAAGRQRRRCIRSPCPDPHRDCARRVPRARARVGTGERARCPMHPPRLPRFPRRLDDPAQARRDGGDGPSSAAASVR